MKNTILIILLSIFLYSCDEEVYTTISTSESHPCYVGEIEVKSGAAIQTFESPYVIDESQCKSQIRKCENGFLEPGSSFFFCQVIENFVSVDSGQFQYITTSNAGVDFSTLIFNDPLTEINNSAYLFLASAQKNNIRIYWPDGNTDNISVDGNSVTTIPVDEKFKIINSSVIEADKVISLDSDNPITVYGLNRAPNQTDAYVGIPTENLGTEYYIGTFASQYGSQVIIAASEDNTTVNVFPVSFIDNKTIVLDAGESIMYETIGSQDLTGTKIVANKKIGVYGGSTWSEVPYSNIGTGDVLLDQMLPTDSWKKLFLTYPLAGRNGGDTVRIIAKDDNTSIFQNDVLLAVIQDQEYVEILGLKDPAKFSSNNNIVSQLNFEPDSSHLTISPWARYAATISRSPATHP